MKEMSCNSKCQIQSPAFIEYLQALLNSCLGNAMHDSSFCLQLYLEWCIPMSTAVFHSVTFDPSAPSAWYVDCVTGLMKALAWHVPESKLTCTCNDCISQALNQHMMPAGCLRMLSHTRCCAKGYLHLASNRTGAGCNGNDCPSAASHQHGTPQQPSYPIVAVRGIQLRTQAADSKLITQDCGIAASFFEPDDSEFGPVMRTWFGVVQEILQIPIADAPPQVFLKVRWYNKNIVGEDPAIRGITRIRCTGGESDYDSSEHSLFRPAMMDYQVFYARMPGHLTTPANRPWLWVAKEVISALTIADHLIDDEGMFIQHDDDDDQ